MGKFQPADTETVTRKNPWEREEFHYKDAPAFILHEHGITISAATVFRWTRDGLPKPDGSGRVYLSAYKKMRRLFIKKADLIAFIEHV